MVIFWLTQLRLVLNICASIQSQIYFITNVYLSKKLILQNRTLYKVNVLINTLSASVKALVKFHPPHYSSKQLMNDSVCVVRDICCEQIILGLTGATSLQLTAAQTDCNVIPHSTKGICAVQKRLQQGRAAFLISCNDLHNFLILFYNFVLVMSLFHLIIYLLIRGFRGSKINTIHFLCYARLYVYFFCHNNFKVRIFHRSTQKDFVVK